MTSFTVNILDAESLEPADFDMSPPTKSTPKEHKSRSKVKKEKPLNKEKKKEPKKDQKKKRKKKSVEDDIDDNLFGSFGLHTVDELLGGLGGVKSPDDVRSEVSEIKTVSETSEIHTEKEPAPVFLRRSKPEHSITEIPSEIRTEKSNKDAYTEDFESSISERVGMSSVANTKSVKFRTRYDSGGGTGDEYTEDFPSDTESIATVSRTSGVSEQTITDSYTAYDESYTYTRR